MKLNPYNEGITRMVNEAIASFCISDNIAKMIAERMGVSNFVFSLRKHVEPETVAATCNAMAKIMRIDRYVQQRARVFPSAHHVPLPASLHHNTPHYTASHHTASRRTTPHRTLLHCSALLRSNVQMMAQGGAIEGLEHVCRMMNGEPE